MMNNINIPGKQYFVDTGFILGIPALLLGFYLYMGADISASFSFLTPSGTSLPGGEEAQLGEKARMTLEALRSTTLDTSIFDDPAYQSLRDYPVTIPETPLGREYPFSTPEEIENMLKKKNTGTFALPPLPPQP